MLKVRVSPWSSALLTLWVTAACGDDRSPIPRDQVEHRQDVVQADDDATAEGDSRREADGGADTVIAADTLVVEPPPEPPEAPAITAQVRSEVAAAVAAARGVHALSGHTFGGYILDGATGTVVYDGASDLLLIPASNTKVFTTAAAIALLGEDHRMVTRLFADGAVDADGVLQGDLHLHGEHDFTWSRWFYADPRYPLDVLIERLWDAGVREVAGDVGVWGAHCFEGHHFGTYSPASHRERVRSQLIAALSDRGISVGGAITGHASMATPPGVEIARWRSVPLWVALWPINRKSHNEMADVLLRHLGYALADDSSYGAGAAQVMAWLEAVGIATDGAVMQDGSGLDTANRFTARQLVELYRVMAELPEGPAWQTSLSVAGAKGPGSTDDNGAAIVTTSVGPYNGTLAWRMTEEDTAGRVFGKSGTNAGITTSGILINRYDGRRYPFAFLMNAIAGGTAYDAARTAQNAMVVAAAGDNLGLGPRPDPPTLVAVEVTGGGSVAVEWAAVDGVVGIEGVDGYFVYSSSDGRVFPEQDRRYVLEPRTILAGGGPADPLYVSVTAVNQAGESDASDVYAARRDPSAARVLLVDGNDRWQAQPANENPMGAPHAFIARYAAALSRVNADSCANEAVVSGRCDLSGYDAVLWALGEESFGDETFDAAEQAVVATYLGGGGRLFVSGAETGWDLDPAGYNGATAADTAFLEGWLKTGYAGDDAGVFGARATPGGLFEGIDELGFYTPGRMFVAYPEQLTPLDGAEPALEYVQERGWAAISYHGSYRLVHLGFPFAAIDSADARAAVMERVLTFFGL